VGDTLTVTGQNLGPIASTVVTLGTATVTQFNPGSGNNVLIFTIPTIFASDQGTPVLLTVSTPNGSASGSITIYPAQPSTPNGTLLVALVQSPSGTIAANQSYTFVFSVTATLNMQETFNVSPSVDAGWPAIYVDNAGNPVLPSQVTMSAGSSAQPSVVSIPVKVTLPQSPGPSGQLQLTITSQRNPAQLTKTSAPFTLTVGQGGPIVSPDIKPSIGFQGTNQNYDGTSVLVPVGSQIAVPFSILLVNPGTYTITIPPVQNDPNKLWTVKLLTSATVTTNKANSTFTGTIVSVSAAAGAPSTQFLFTVASQANPSDQTQLPQPIKLKTS
jgi:hypothetical protein